MSKELIDGMTVLISDKNHPWYGEKGELVSYGKYGLECLNLEGWLIQLAMGNRTYAKASQVKKL